MNGIHTPDRISPLEKRVPESDFDILKQVRYIKRLLLLLFVSCISGASLFGQVEGPCAESLSRANRELEAGHFYEIAGILRDCIQKNNFSREQKIQAYYLLTRTYLFLDRADSAEISFLKLLKEDPEYKVTEENDPIEMVYLSEKFVTTPVFSLKAGGGTNFSHVSMVDPFHGTDNSENSEEIYKMRWAYQLYGGVELHFGNTLSLEANLVTEVNRYYYSNKFNGEDFTEDLYAMYSVKSPVFIKYTFEHDKIRPYIFAGYQPGFLLYANDKHTSTNNEKQPTVEEEYSSFMSEENINRLGFRAFYGHSVVGGAGVIYKVNYNAVFFEMRYVLGLNTIVTEHFSSDKDRFKETSYYYGWPVGAPNTVTEDDYRLNNLLIQVGYIWPLYKPRKKNEMTLRELFSKSQQ